MSERPSKKARIDKDLVPTKAQLLPTTFKVIAGSYEKLLYGLEGSTSISENGVVFHLKPIFIFPAHVSCIKSVAASPNGGKWLATGSADEIIKVWDLRRRKEIGGLMHHEGSITHLSFPTRSHLLSASEDGTLTLFRARDWAVLRTLKGHKGRVNSVAIHPTGKVGLSVGKDRTLRMWDMMRGKGSASTKIHKEGEVVRWSTTGSHFIVQSGSSIDLYSTDMTLLHSIQHPSRIHDVLFTRPKQSSEDFLLVTAEDKKTSVYVQGSESAPPYIIAELIGHENRVKAIQTLTIALPTSLDASTLIACTVSSDGKIHVYDLSQLPNPETSAAPAASPLQIHPVAVYDSKGTRLTCVAVADGEDLGDEEGSVVGEKRKRGAEKEVTQEMEGEEEEAWGGIVDVEVEEDEADIGEEEEE